MHRESRATSESFSGPSAEEFRNDVLAGLRSQPKQLFSKYLYDQRGSQLFDQICELPEYYPTRTEVAIMNAHVGEMARRIGSHAMVIELGSGSSTKTSRLLEQVPRPVAYVPVDISGAHLLESAERIAREFPDIEVLPLHADFTQPFEVPECQTRIERRVVYFPGSTIGNFRPQAASELLERIAQLVGPGGGLLVGFDLVKDESVLTAAYDDAENVTAAFNKNLLERINNELDGNFSLDAFQHRAVYNREHDRIEMHLVSRTDQTVTIGDEQIEFAAGETIRTELSHKYRVETFAELARSAGLVSQQVWTDPKQLFAVAYFAVPQ